MKGYFVYFYYGSNDELLYIGKAVDVGKRWQSHSEDWKNEVCKVGVRKYPDHASMDIFEHYYITKLPTKYNKGLLYHGSTTVNINDSSTMTIYSLEDFKKKYVLSTPTKRKNQQRTQYNTIDEKYIALGYKIIYTNKVNYFDKSLWENDLNKTLFRFKNVCFQIASLETKRQLSTTVNQCVRSLYKLLNRAIELTERYVIAEIDGDFLTIKDVENAEECSRVDLEFIGKYKNGREHFCCSCVGNIFGGTIVYEENNKNYIKITFPPRNMKEFNVTLDKSNFTFDLELCDNAETFGRESTIKSTF